MEEYHPASDPALYFLCALFAAIVTFLPSFTGHHWLLTGFQGLGLWIFTGVAARYGPPGRHTIIFALWILIQILTLVLAHRMNPTAVEQTIPMGFALHREWLEMHYTGGGTRTGSIAHWWTLPLQGLQGSAGSLVTGGLLGSLLLAQAVNRLGLGTAVLVNDVMVRDPSGAGSFLWSVMPWEPAIFMLGICSMHLALTPRLWRQRTGEAVTWPLQRPMLYAGIGLTVAGMGLQYLGAVL